MGLEFKYSRRSAAMGSLLVSWDLHEADKINGRKNFKRRVGILILSVCAGVVVPSVLLFLLLCRLDEAVVTSQQQPWRSLKPSSLAWFPKLNDPPPVQETTDHGSTLQEPSALHGLGSLFRRGEKAMDELLVANLSEDLSSEDLRLFLRTLHRSGVSTRADLIFLFPFSPIPLEMRHVIHEEEKYLQDLLILASHQTLSAQTVEHHPLFSSNSSLSKFNYQLFNVSTQKIVSFADLEPTGRVESVKEDEGGSTEHGIGSVSGYEMTELDPSFVLAAFLIAPSAELRRWFCYQLLLGMLRNSYRHVLLCDAGETLVLGDALAAVRRHKDILYLFSEDRTWMEASDGSKRSHGQQNPSIATEVVPDTDQAAIATPEITPKTSPQNDFLNNRVEILLSDASESNLSTVKMKTQVDEDLKEGISGGKSQGKVVPQGKSKGRRKGMMEAVYGEKLWASLEPEEREKKLVVSKVMVGSMKAMNSLTSVMANEIVRLALQRKSKDPFPDQAVLNYIIHKSSVLGKKVKDHLRIITNQESRIYSLSTSDQIPDLSLKNSRVVYAISQNHHVAHDESQQLSKIMAAKIRDDICSSPLESTVYRDCQKGRNSSAV